MRTIIVGKVEYDDAEFSKNLYTIDGESINDIFSSLIGDEVAIVVKDYEDDDLWHIKQED